MTIPEVVRCPDGRFRRAIYGIGPYIADYPEQALLACTVQGWCPKCVFWRACILHFKNDLFFMPRCTSRPENLDEKSPRRCREHWETIVDAFKLGTLWDEYGVVGNIVVRVYFHSFAFLFLLLSCVTAVTFYNLHIPIVPDLVPVLPDPFCCARYRKHWRGNETTTSDPYSQAVGSLLYLVCRLTHDKSSRLRLGLVVVGW